MSQPSSNSVVFKTLRSLEGYLFFDGPAVQGIVEAQTPNPFDRVMRVESDPELELLRRLGARRMIVPIQQDKDELAPFRPEVEDASGGNLIEAFLNTEPTGKGIVAFSNRFGPLTIPWPQAGSEARERAIGGESVDLWVSAHALARDIITSSASGDDNLLDAAAESREFMGIHAQLVREPLTREYRFALAPESLYSFILLHVVLLRNAGATFRKCASDACNNLMVIGGGRGRTGYASKNVCSSRCRSHVSRQRRAGTGAPEPEEKPIPSKASNKGRKARKRA